MAITEEESIKQSKKYKLFALKKHMETIVKEKESNGNPPETYWSFKLRRYKNSFLNASSIEQLHTEFHKLFMCCLELERARKLYTVDLEYNLQYPYLFEYKGKLFESDTDEEFLFYANVVMDLAHKFCGVKDVFDKYVLSDEPFETLAVRVVKGNQYVRTANEESLHNIILNDECMKEIESLPHISINVLVEAAKTRIQLKQFERAKIILTKAQDISPLHKPDVMSLLCDVLSELGDHENAYASIDMVKEANPLKFATYLCNHLHDYARAKEWYLKAKCGDGLRGFFWMAKQSHDAFTHDEQMEFYDHHLVCATCDAYTKNMGGKCCEDLIDEHEILYKNCVWLPHNMVYDYRNEVATDKEKIPKGKENYHYSLFATALVVDRLVGKEHPEVVRWCYETAITNFLYTSEEKDHLIECIKRSEFSVDILATIHNNFSGLLKMCYERNYKVAFGPLDALPTSNKREHSGINATASFLGDILTSSSRTSPPGTLGAVQIALESFL
jgi:hypothetical protein